MHRRNLPERPKRRPQNRRTKMRILHQQTILNQVRQNMLFKKHLLAKVMDGTKTQTRRIHKRTLKVGRTYGVTCRRYQKSQGHIKILRASPQRLFNVTEEEAKAEGFNNLAEFLEAWIKINGYLIPWQTVTTYEFQQVIKAKENIPT